VARWFGFLALSAALAGCGGTYSVAASFRPPTGVSAQASPELAAHPLRRIAVLPFRNESGVPEAGAKMAGHFYERLSASPRYEVQPPPVVEAEEDVKFEFRLRGGRTEGVRNREEDSAWLKEKVSRFIATVQPYVTNLETVYPGEYFEGQAKPEKREALQGTVAEASPQAPAEGDLDAILTGVVTSYRDRSGGPYLGDQGAHVSYAAYLVSAKDGRILWEASFNEEQIFLLDNLLLFPRYAQEGFAWQTNDTLARNGLQRVLERFPGFASPAEEGASATRSP